MGLDRSRGDWGGLRKVVVGLLAEVKMGRESGLWGGSSVATVLGKVGRAGGGGGDMVAAEGGGGRNANVGGTLPIPLKTVAAGEGEPRGDDENNGAVGGADSGFENREPANARAGEGEFPQQSSSQEAGDTTDPGLSLAQGQQLVMELCDREFLQQRETLTNEVLARVLDAVNSVATTPAMDLTAAHSADRWLKSRLDGAIEAVVAGLADSVCVQAAPLLRENVVAEAAENATEKATGAAEEAIAELRTELAGGLDARLEDVCELIETNVERMILFWFTGTSGSDEYSRIWEDAGDGAVGEMVSPTDAAARWRVAAARWREVARGAPAVRGEEEPGAGVGEAEEPRRKRPLPEEVVAAAGAPEEVAGEQHAVVGGAKLPVAVGGGEQPAAAAEQPDVTAAEQPDVTAAVQPDAAAAEQPAAAERRNSTDSARSHISEPTAAYDAHYEVAGAAVADAFAVAHDAHAARREDETPDAAAAALSASEMRRNSTDSARSHMSEPTAAYDAHFEAAGAAVANAFAVAQDAHAARRETSSLHERPEQPRITGTANNGENVDREYSSPYVTANNGENVEERSS